MDVEKDYKTQDYSINLAMNTTTNDSILLEETVELISKALQCEERRFALWSDRNNIYRAILNALSSFLNKESNFEMQKLQIVSRAMLQLEQFLHMDWKSVRTITSDLDRRIWRISIKTLINEDFPTDSSLLVSSAFALFLNSLWEPEKVARVACVLLNKLNEKPEDDSPMDFNAITGSFLDIEFTSKATPCFSVLLLIHGFLNCGQKDCLLTMAVNELLILEFFQYILELCHAKHYYQFHAFQLLLSWLQFVARNLKDIINNQHNPQCEPSLFSYDSHIVRSLMDLCDANWENPINGVTEFLRKSYTLMVNIGKLSEQLLKNETNSKSDLVEILTRETIKLSNSCKGKYFALSVLIPHFGVCNLMAICNTFPTDLAASLSANHLASAGSDVYRIILSVVRQEVDEMDLVNFWALSWLDPLLSVLQHKNSIVQQNAIRYWLPITLQLLPNCYKLIYCSTSDLSTKIILMKAARRMGTVTYDQLDIAVIKCALLHSSERLRSEAFAILCSTLKKAEPLSGEVSICQEFLPLNLNIYDSAFRQQLYTNLQSLLIRLRDSCTTSLSSSIKNHTSPSPLLDTWINFVEWLWTLLLDNMQPGVCYQRRQTCLELLKAVLSTFVANVDCKKQKGAVPDRTVILTEYVKSKNKWNFISPKARSVLLVCLMDYMAEIKETSCNLLEEYFMRLADDSQEDLNSALDLGFILCNSPKAFLSSSGSLILKYLFSRAQINREDFIQCIFDKLNAQFQLAKSDILEAAKTAPMHGLVLTLQRILCESKVDAFWKSARSANKVNQMIVDIISLVQDIANFCLNVLAMNTSELDVSPSFADMGQAIDDIRLKNKSCDETRTEVVLSLEHEFVLACYWLNLKHCSHLVGNMISCLPIQTNSTLEDCQVFITASCVEKVGNILVSIMQRTRHRGAIEACGEALKLFCGRLFESTDKRLLQIPSIILNSALRDVEATATVTSVTRRSAGLAILAPAVVSCEIRARQRKTFEMTMKKLMDVARLPVGEYTDQCTDLPQSQSLHILRAFVHDACLTQDVHPYLEDTMVICLDVFTSPSWAIRNAALQLYGAVIPKLFGQKKVSEEGSCKNMVNARQFFGRYPHLANILLKHLTDFNSTNHSTLIPILAILTRLTPQSSFTDDSVKLCQFASCLKKFLSSPIWHVRKMTAAAFSAVTDQDSAVVVCQDLASSISEDNAHGYNQIHGYILALRNLLACATPKPDCAEIENLRDKLHNCTWLLAGQNKCAVVKIAAWKLFLNLPTWLNFPLQEIVSDCITTERTSLDMLWMPGEKQCSGFMARLLLRSCLVHELPVHVRLFLLGSDSGQDCKMACLKYLGTNINSNNYNWTDVQDVLLDAALDEPLPSILHSILDLVLNLFIEKGICSKKFETKDFQDFFERKATAENFTTVAALAMEMWSIGIKVRIKNTTWSVTDKDVEMWTKFICNKSMPHQSELFRKHAANSLQIAGPIVLHTISKRDQQIPGYQEIVVFIFDAGMSLLQDENMEVRQEASRFASLLNGENNTPSSFHVNYAIQLLGEYVTNKFWSFISLRNHLWEKLNDPTNTFACIQSQMDSTLVLFQQDDINVYAEPCLISKFYLELLQNIVLKMRHECDNPTFVSWINSTYKTVIEDALNVVDYLENINEMKLFELLSCGKTPSILANLRSRLRFLITANPSLKEHIEEVILRLDRCRPRIIQTSPESS